MRRTGRFLAKATAAAATLAVVVGGVALADDISNNIDGTIDATTEAVSLTVGGTTRTVGLYINTQPSAVDGDNGCNLDGAAESLVLNVVSSNAAVVGVSPSTVAFTGPGCGDTPAVTVTPLSTGTATVTFSQRSNTSGGSFNLSPATFSVSVVPPADTTKPTLNLPDDITVPATSPDGAAVTFTATASDANPAQPAVSCTPASGATFPVGTTTVDCSATDAAGNTATGTITVTVEAYVEPDTAAPQIAPHADVTAETADPAGTPVDYDPPAVSDDTDPNPAITCDPAPGSSFPIGSTTVTCTATDASGKTSTSTFAVVVTLLDIVAPEVAVTGDFSVEATGPAGAPVEFSATATDAVDGDVPVVCRIGDDVLESGDVLPLGVHPVVCSATDAAGNTGTREVTATVADTTGPTIAPLADITAEATARGTVVTFSAAATDLVDGVVPVRCEPASGHAFPVGTTEVVCTAEDASGNPSEERFSVTVTDTTAPVLVVSEGEVVEATGPAGAAVGYTATADDAVDGEIVPGCEPASGSTFPLATTTVTCTATDAAGNGVSDTFTVTVQDTTPPEVTVPEDISAEATGPEGTAVSFEVGATDVVDLDVPVTCENALSGDPVASGDTFPVGDTLVTCSATDAAGNPASAMFLVTVTDETPPVIASITDVTAEATGPDGAAVTFVATASDVVDEDVPVTCTPGTGSTFPLGTTEVTCTAQDDAGNPAEPVSFTVTVQDTTEPTLVLPTDLSTEATGPAGATVEFGPTASDSVDTEVPVVCTPASGSTFPLGPTTVECTATDESDNIAEGAFTVTVVDTTAPVIADLGDVTEEATGPTGAVATFTASASDAVDGDAVAVTCDPGSGSTFPLGATTVGCTATDAAGNAAAAKSFTVTVRDTTAPANITFVGGPAAGASYAGTAVPAPGTCTATDAVTTSPSCVVTGYGSAPGTHTLIATATDATGNTATATRTYTVAFRIEGFFAPTDMGGVLNTVKNGSTVPLKFRVFHNGAERTDPAAVKGFTATPVNCTSGAEDAVEELGTTGGTALRYDTTGKQFIQNWKTPTGAGKCYTVTMTTADNSTLTARFKLR